MLDRRLGSAVGLTPMTRALCVSGLAWFAIGCGPGEVDARRDAGGAGGEVTDGGEDASVDVDFGGGNSGGLDLSSCVNLQCRQVGCPVGQETTLTGAVKTPKGDLPLYNVTVFVPNAAVLPLAAGVSCESCASFTAAMPLVSALTGPDGKFTLKNVPTGANVPVVLQVGRWRKQLVIPNVAPCTSAAIDPTMLNMPRKQSEGDIPRIAIATGYADPFECLLTKIGLDVTEVTAPTGSGRVSYFRTLHTDASLQPANGIDLAGGAPDANTLFENLNELKKYDVVLLPCESSEWGGKTATAAANVKAYADAGGRLFATHYSYTWLYGIKGTASPLPWSAAGVWNVDQRFDEFASSQLVGKVDTSFAKGVAFSQWLANVGASLGVSELVISQWRHDLDLASFPPSTRWVYGATPAFRYRNGSLCGSDAGCAVANRPCVKNSCTSLLPASATDNSVQHITFNTPINQPAANQCGRVVYSDFHVSASALKDPADPTNLGTFPSICKSEAPSAQEKALIFMLFDLSACVQPDSVPPEPPPPIL